MEDEEIVDVVDTRHLPVEKEQLLYFKVKNKTNFLSLRIINKRVRNKCDTNVYSLVTQPDTERKLQQMYYEGKEIMLKSIKFLL